MPDSDPRIVQQIRAIATGLPEKTAGTVHVIAPGPFTHPEVYEFLEEWDRLKELAKMGETYLAR